MPVPGRLIHARWKGAVGRAFRQKVTVQQNVATDGDLGEAGQEWVNLEGCVNLPAAVSVTAVTGARRSERRRTDEVNAVLTHRIVLIPAYRPEIREHMRAIVSGGPPYEIDAVDCDSQLEMTRLLVRRVT